MTTTATTDRFTVTFTRSGRGAGHAAHTNLIPLCGSNVNKPHANPQIQARDWSKVTCKRCKTIVADQALTDTWTVWGSMDPNQDSQPVEDNLTREAAIARVDALHAEGHTDAYAADSNSDDVYPPAATSERPQYRITGVWLSPDGDEVAVQFDDGTVSLESHGGSRSAGCAWHGNQVPADWRLLHGHRPMPLDCRDVDRPGCPGVTHTWVDADGDLRLCSGARPAEIEDLVASIAAAARDHGKCRPNAHTRDAGTNTRQLGDDDSDGQLVDQHGDMLCNDCEAPMAYCTTHDVYVHVDPDTPPCFLVREALPQMECEGCGGVQNVSRWWDGEQMRYADPECAATMYFTELAVVKLGDTVNENYSASGEDLSTTDAEITAAGETLAEFGGPVSEEFDVDVWDRLLADAGFRRVGFWNFVEYTAPVVRLDAAIEAATAHRPGETAAEYDQRMRDV